jgi:hypothetical protein
MPLGTSAPALRKRSGSRRKATTSWTSCFTSLYPATSLKRVVGSCGLWTFAVDLPILPIIPIWPLAWRFMYQKKAMKMASGNIQMRSKPRKPLSSGSALMTMSCSRSSCSSRPSWPITMSGGSVVENGSSSVVSPVTR